MTFTHGLATNNYGCSKFIVDANAANGTHTTIAAALTSATSGDTIFIRPGTYTENLTLKAGVNLTAYGSDSFSGTVTISGNATFTAAGTVNIAGIRLQTNSAALLTVSGSSASVVNLFNCYLNCTNATGISYTSSSASSAINIKNCIGDIGTTGISLYSMSSIGLLSMANCSSITNTGASTTASSNSAGIVNIVYSILHFPLSTSSTGVLVIASDSFISTSATNTTCVTTAGTGSSAVAYSTFTSGTASALSIGAGTTLNVYKCIVTSSNTNAITGAGTLGYTDISFTGTSSVMNPTTKVFTFTELGQWKSQGQPAFLAYLATTATDKTGAGTTYTLGTDALTEVFDQNGDFNTNGTFTAPVTGRYQLNAMTQLIGCTINIANVTQIVTSNRTFINNVGRTASATSLSNSISQLCDMDAADTATVTVAGFGEAGDTDDIAGGATSQNCFSGILLA